MHFMLYFATSGKIKFVLNNNPFIVSENALILIPPACSFFFEAISGSASIYWVAFWGAAPKTYLDLANLNAITPIFKCANDMIRSYMKVLVNECKPENYSDCVKAIGCLYMIFALLTAPQNRKLTLNQKRKLEYANEAIAYIRQNYMNNIGVKEICGHVSLERTYFSALFKEAIGISPIAYLIKYRIDQSILYMQNPLLSITEIASLVGFTDLVSFSVRFKALTSESPREYRKGTTSAPHYIASVFEKP